VLSALPLLPSFCSVLARKRKGVELIPKELQLLFIMIIVAALILAFVYGWFSKGLPVFGGRPLIGG